MIARSRKEGQHTAQVGRLLTVTFVLSSSGQHVISSFFVFSTFSFGCSCVDTYVWLYATISTHRNNMSQSSQSPQHQDRLESSAKGHRRRRWEFSKLRSAQLLPPNILSLESNPTEHTRNVRFFSCFSLLYAFLFSVLFCVELLLVCLKRTILHPKSPHGYEQQAHIRQKWEPIRMDREDVQSSFRCAYAAAHLCVFFSFSTIVSSSAVELTQSEKKSTMMRIFFDGH